MSQLDASVSPIFRNEAARDRARLVIAVMDGRGWQRPQVVKVLADQVGSTLRQATATMTRTTRSQ